jgi:hypothetical protein
MFWQNPKNELVLGASASGTKKVRTYIKGHSKKTKDPDVCLIHFRGTNQPQKVFLEFMFSTFLGVSP